MGITYTQRVQCGFKVSPIKCKSGITYTQHVLAGILIYLLTGQTGKMKEVLGDQ